MNKLKVAIWGYGFEGNIFLAMSQDLKYNLIEIYDKDENEHQDYPIRVTDFNNRNLNVDTIVITNTCFAKEIIKQVKEVNENIRIFDFGAFIEYGKTFEECEC